MKITGRRLIIKDVMSKGVTARKAAKTVNVVFERMKFALSCGDKVPIPGGTIQTHIRKGKPRSKYQRFQNVNTGEGMFKIIKYSGRRRVIKFTPDESLDLTPPPAPKTSEQVEACQRVTELLELNRPADNALMATLQQAFEVHPTPHGSLLLRLRAFKARGWKFDFVNLLAEQVALNYWL